MSRIILWRALNINEKNKLYMQDMGLSCLCNHDWCWWSSVVFTLENIFLKFILSNMEFFVSVCCYWTDTLLMANTENVGMGKACVKMLKTDLYWFVIQNVELYSMVIVKHQCFSSWWSKKNNAQIKKYIFITLDIGPITQLSQSVV